jgi:hypothetical protein
MRLLHIAVIIVAATVCLADTITLKDGRVIHGTYLGGTARQMRIEMGDQIQTLDVSDVARIEFGGSAPMAEQARRTAGGTARSPAARGAGDYAAGWYEFRGPHD